MHADDPDPDVDDVHVLSGKPGRDRPAAVPGIV